MIYKAPSIYNLGGGGGGYSDGGELIDGDFIKVENNTVSSYDNVSRDTLNFYIEVKDGEVVNSVIELTNEYNATVNVYIVQNGLFIPLGNVGGDNVNLGNQYNISVVGNSFEIENVTPSQNYPKFAKIAGKIYGLCKIGNTLYTTEDLDTNIDSYSLGDFPDYEVPKNKIEYKYNGKTFYNPERYLDLLKIITPFRIIKNNDSFISYNSRDLISVADGGTNSTGFNLRKNGGTLEYHEEPSVLWINNRRFTTQVAYMIENSGSFKYLAANVGDYDPLSVTSSAYQFSNIRVALDL